MIIWSWFCFHNRFSVIQPTETEPTEKLYREKLNVQVSICNRPPWRAIPVLCNIAAVGSQCMQYYCLWVYWCWYRVNFICFRLFTFYSKRKCLVLQHASCLCLINSEMFLCIILLTTYLHIYCHWGPYNVVPESFLTEFDYLWI